MTRDLQVGSVLSRIFAIYGDQAKVLLPVAFAIFLALGLLGALLASIAPALALIALVVQIVATTVFSGMVVELVNDVQDGRRDSSVGGLFRAVGGVLVPLVLAGLLVGLIVGIGILLLIIPGLILLTLFAVVAPAIVVERVGVIAALRRSRELVSGNGVQVFLVIVVVFLLSIVLGLVVGAIGAAAGDAGAFVASLVANTLTAPISALAAGVLYFELRRAKDELGPAAAAPGPDAVESWPAPSSFPGASSPEQPHFTPPQAPEPPATPPRTSGDPLLPPQDPPRG